ncbi:hypothetical protein [Dyella sp. ASV21]|uniref:hypothetical protein n=1 Tax=Dyella sp. ASV21 TaxID=2795114 RepID=UPI0018EC3382|nr:hypothetical protein [Dyella sp. ASV21]
MSNAHSKLRHAAEMVLIRSDDTTRANLKSAIDEALLAELREERPAIVIVMEDGVIQDAITTVPMDCMVIDYAPVAETNPDQFIKVDWGEGRSSEAVVSLTEPEVHADYVVGRLKAYRDSNGKEC